MNTSNPQEYYFQRLMYCKGQIFPRSNMVAIPSRPFIQLRKGHALYRVFSMIMELTLVISSIVL